VIGITVPEGAQGNTDLNGDGDALDIVAHVYDTRKASLRNLGIAQTASATGEHLSAFVVREADQGHTDLNGDGDATDSVYHTYDHDTELLVNLVFAGTSTPFVSGHDVLFAPWEGYTGTDYNGDGDASDTVVHLLNGTTGAIVNSAITLWGDSVRLPGRPAGWISRGTSTRMATAIPTMRSFTSTTR
jgi:hypothetical protein